MRIGNGPRLVVPRPGTPGRRRWYVDSRGRGLAYDEHRARERERLRAMPTAPAGDRKKHGVLDIMWAERGGLSFRAVDAHGRSYGRRYTDTSDLPAGARVRRVDRQPETLHSLASRMLKRAHRLAMRED